MTAPDKVSVRFLAHQTRHLLMAYIKFRGCSALKHPLLHWTFNILVVLAISVTVGLQEEKNTIITNVLLVPWAQLTHFGVFFVVLIA